MSEIEWLRNPDGSKGKTWNPTLGCTRVDHRCDKCYAIRVAGRQMSPAHRGLTKIRPKTASRPGIDWSGRVTLHPERLEDPTKWKKPQRVFVDSMSDLFHEHVPFEYVDRVFEVMERCPQHTFIILTKRAERMREYSRRDDPLPNVQLGVSVSGQDTADADLPVLLETDAFVRLVSIEPLLGPVDLRRYVGALDWVIVGGESGSGARSCDVAWIRAIVGQCRTAEVACFVKQLGSNHLDERVMDTVVFGEFAAKLGLPHGERGPVLHRITYGKKRSKGNDPSVWPRELRVHQYPPREHPIPKAKP